MPENINRDLEAEEYRRWYQDQRYMSEHDQREPSGTTRRLDWPWRGHSKFAEEPTQTYNPDRYGAIGAYRPSSSRTPARSAGTAARTGPYAGVGPKNYNRPDERIREHVCDLLAIHDELDARKIEVQVHEGIVTLRGEVRNRYMRNLAGAIADEVIGVRGVDNDLHTG